MKTSFISSNRKYERLYKLESRKGFNNHNSKYENHKIKIDTFDYIKINQNSGGKTHTHIYKQKTNDKMAKTSIREKGNLHENTKLLRKWQEKEK